VKSRCACAPIPRARPARGRKYIFLWRRNFASFFRFRHLPAGWHPHLNPLPSRERI